MKLFIAGLLALSSLAAAADALEVTNTAEVWLLGRWQGLNSSSPFNPNNTVLDLAGESLSTELLWETRARNGPLGFKLRVRGVNDHCDCTDGVHGDLYASQAYLKWQLDDETSIALGRQLLTWGPGTYRSPSNPFYFDAGRTNLFRELSGLDAIQIASFKEEWSWHFAHVVGSGHVGGREGENFSGSQLGTIDYRGTSFVRAEFQSKGLNLGAVAARQRHGKAFIGTHAGWSKSDGWLLWGELGWGHRPWTVSASARPVPALNVEMSSKAAATALAGVSYTFDKGQSLQAEYLYDGHGFSRSQAAVFAETGAQAALLLGGPQTHLGINTLFEGARYAPASLSRHYLALAWQASAQRERLLGRVTWHANMVDHSHRTSFYVEYAVSRHVSWLFSLVVDKGSQETEFGSLIRHRLTAGLKFRLF